MPIAQYMQQMKALGDVMAAAGSSLSNDELVDYIITGLGKEYNAITATLTLGNKSVAYDEFCSHILSFEALQEQQECKISPRTGPPRRTCLTARPLLHLGSATRS
jgi:hypothetical protein